MATTQTRAERTAAMKERVRTAAARLFAQQGFSDTGVRQIAAEAGVDPANVARYFGSKEGLFLQTMTLPDRWGEVLEGPLDSLSEDYLRLVLCEEPAGEQGAILAALMRTSDRAEVAEALRQQTEALFSDRLAPRLLGEDALLRAHLFAAAMTGIQVALWVSIDPVLTDHGLDAVIAAYAPALQGILTPQAGLV